MDWHYESPIGSITLSGDGAALTGLRFDGQDTLSDRHGESPVPPVFAQAEQWLDTYFSGNAPDFTPPLRLDTTPFRRAVWELLLTIPFGHTMTYGEIARIIAAQRGLPRMSAQAVGGALERNPIALIIPCHRVVGADGSLTGYAGGMERKRWLLNMEQAEVCQHGKNRCLFPRHRLSL